MISKRVQSPREKSSSAKLGDLGRFLRQAGFDTQMGVVCCIPAYENDKFGLHVQTKNVLRMAAVIGYERTLEDILSASQHLFPSRNFSFFIPLDAEDGAFLEGFLEGDPQWKVPNTEETYTAIRKQADNKTSFKMSTHAAWGWPLFVESFVFGPPIDEFMIYMGLPFQVGCHVGFGWQANTIPLRPKALVLHDEIICKCKVARQEFLSNRYMGGPAIEVPIQDTRHDDDCLSHKPPADADLCLTVRVRHLLLKCGIKDLVDQRDQETFVSWKYGSWKNGAPVLRRTVTPLA